MISRLATRIASQLLAVLLCVMMISPSFGAPVDLFNAQHSMPVLSGDAPKTTGVSSGDASVSTQTGALQYSYPIVVPPGRLGNQPSLALTYSSQEATYGGLAAGWTLPMPEIRLDTSEGRLDSDYFFSPEDRRKYMSTLAGGHRLVAGRGGILPPDIEALLSAQYDTTYARYEKIEDEHALRFRVLTTNGLTYHFGEQDKLGGGSAAEDLERAPLTSTVDVFGNTVEYHWTPTVTVGATKPVDFVLTRIEYTSNPRAGLDAHAVVEFEYDPPVYCAGSEVPVGARLDWTTGRKRIHSPQPLRRVRTLAVDPDSGGLRTVRELELTYDAAAASCTAPHAPIRLLDSIQETGFSPDGTATMRPPVTFEYGPRARQVDTEIAFAFPPISTADRDEAAVSWGFRSGLGGWATVEAMYHDVDGDGLQDRLYMGGTPGTCTARWKRNSGDSFEVGTRSFALPRVSTAFDGDCSLNRQAFVARLHDPRFEECTNPSEVHFLAYRFMELSGDDKADLVVALHYDPNTLTPDEETLELLGLVPPPTCTGTGACPNVQDSCLGNALVCPGTVGAACSVDLDIVNACLDTDVVPCGDFMLESHCISLPGPSPCADPPSTDTVPPCEERKAHEACGRYVWYVYDNLGNGDFSNIPRPILSPVELEPNEGSSSMGAAKGGFSTSVHALMDVTGDGHIDALTWRSIPGLDGFPIENNWFFVFPGDGRGRFRTDEDGRPFVWFVPSGAKPGASVTGSEMFGDNRTIGTTGALQDINADGLPDLVWDTPLTPDQLEVYFNDGTSFVHYDDPFEKTTLSSTLPFVSKLFIDVFDADPFFIHDAERTASITSADFDTDGRPDFLIASAAVVPEPTIALALMNNHGDRVREDLLAIPPAADKALRQRTRTDLNPVPAWFVETDFIDLTGDGYPDLVDFSDPFAPRLVSDPPDTPPMRLLHTVDNGRGGRVDVSYSPHTRAEDENGPVVVQDHEAGRTLAKTTWVVRELTMRDTIDPPSSEPTTTRFTYFEPVSTKDWLGRFGFRGFARVEAARVLPDGATGSVTEERFAYAADGTDRTEVLADWSGRMVETGVYFGGTDGPAHTITRQHWRRLTLPGGERDAFHSEATQKFTCLPGQGRQECIDDGVERVGIRDYALLEDSFFVLHNEFSTGRISGDLEFEITSEGIEFLDYTPAPGDRQLFHTYIFNGPLYLLREESSRMVDLFGGSVAWAKITVWDNLLRTPTVECVGRLASLFPRPKVSDEACTVRSFHATTGQVLTVQKPEQVENSGPSMSLEYDPYLLWVAGTTNELGHTVVTERDYGTGAVLRTLGPNIAAECGGDPECPLEEAITQIDGFGRPVATFGSVDDETKGYITEQLSRITYDDLSRPTRILSENRIEFDGLSFDDTATTQTIESFDGSGRIIEQRTLSFNSVPDAVRRYHYDDRSNVTAFDAPDPSREDGALVTYRYEYDSVDRLIANRRPDGTGANYFFAGLVSHRCEHVPDPATDTEEPLATTVTRVDAFGRIVEVREALSSSVDCPSAPGTEFATWTYSYDVQDNLKAIADPEGNLTEIEHDLRSNRIRVQRGDRVWKYAYDLNDNLILATSPHPAGADPALHSVSTTYDHLDRIESQIAGTRTLDPGNTASLAADAMTEYIYDDVCENGKGRLCQVAWRRPGADVSYGVAYQYDSRGNVVEELRSFDLEPLVGLPLADARVVERRFNALNRVTTVGYGDGLDPSTQTLTETAYDRRGLPDTVTWLEPGAPPRVLADLHRNTAGRITRATSGDYAREWLYDQNGRVVADTVVAGSEFEMSELITYYGGDDVRELVSERTGMPIHITQFEYDSQHQLLVADDNKGYLGTFGYSASGRLQSAMVEILKGGSDKKEKEKKKPKKPPKDSDIAVRDVSYEYAGADPEAVTALLNPDDTPYATYAYAEAGGVTSRITDEGTWTFGYDGFDRQRVATAPDGSRELYYYGKDGQRWLALTFSPDGGVKQLRFWHGPTEVWYDEFGAVERTWAHVAHGSPIARIENLVDLEYTFHNGLEHLMAAIEPDGHSEVAYVYGPFGEILEMRGDVDDHLRRFNGKEEDEATGLSYYGYRYYDQTSLTWTRADPLSRFVPEHAGAEPRRANLYTFSLNNALRYFDPDGLDVSNDDFRGMEKRLEEQRQKRIAEFLHEHCTKPGIVPSSDCPGNTNSRVDMPCQGACLEDDFEEELAEVRGEAAERALLAVDLASLAAGGAGIIRHLIKKAAQKATKEVTEGVTEKVVRGAAEEKLGEELVDLAGRAKKRQPAVTVGAASRETGEAAVGRSVPGPNGCCAEVDAAAKVGGKVEDVTFTRPVRPRTGEIVPVCKACQEIFEKWQFPPGTPFE